MHTLANGNVVVDYGATIAARPTVLFRHGVAGRAIAMHVGNALDPDGSLALDLSRERLAWYAEGLGDAWDADLVRTCRPNAAEPARKAALELLRARKPPPPEATPGSCFWESWSPEGLRSAMGFGPA